MAAEIAQLGVNMVSGGTDNHLMLIRPAESGVTGKELEHRLDEVYITGTRTPSPTTPSPFVTSASVWARRRDDTRLRPDEMKQIGGGFIRRPQILRPAPKKTARAC
jgi:glycine hydroxymethyltransferase